MAPPAGIRKRNIVSRIIVHPLRELVAGVKDARSPEMREINERKMITELARDGDARFVATWALQFTAAILTFSLLVSLGRILGGAPASRVFGFGEIIRQYVVPAAIAATIGAIAAGVSAKRLRRKYPNELADEPEQGS